MIVIIPKDWFWHIYNFIWYILMFLAFVFYIPKDGHMFSRNM